MLMRIVLFLHVLRQPCVHAPASRAGVGSPIQRSDLSARMVTRAAERWGIIQLACKAPRTASFVFPQRGRTASNSAIRSSICCGVPLFFVRRRYALIVSFQV